MPPRGAIPPRSFADLESEPDRQNTQSLPQLTTSSFTKEMRQRHENLRTLEDLRAQRRREEAEERLKKDSSRRKKKRQKNGRSFGQSSSEAMKMDVTSLWQVDLSGPRKRKTYNWRGSTGNHTEALMADGWESTGSFGNLHRQKAASMPAIRHGSLRPDGVQTPGMQSPKSGLPSPGGGAHGTNLFAIAEHNKNPLRDITICSQTPGILKRANREIVKSKTEEYEALLSLLVEEMRRSASCEDFRSFPVIYNPHRDIFVPPATDLELRTKVTEALARHGAVARIEDLPNVRRSVLDYIQMDANQRSRAIFWTAVGRGQRPVEHLRTLNFPMSSRWEGA